MRVLALVAGLLVGTPSLAESVVAARTIRPHTVLVEQDLTIVPRATPGGISDIALLVGQETRVALYAGRPVRPSDVGPPAIVDRNQIVQITFAVGGLTITTEARALGRGGAGDVVRVLNLSSRTTVAGRIHSDGTVWVQ